MSEIPTVVVYKGNKRARINVVALPLFAAGGWSTTDPAAKPDSKPEPKPEPYRPPRLRQSRA